MNIAEAVFFVGIGVMIGMILISFVWLELMLYAVRSGLMKIKKRDGKWLDLK